MQGTPPPPDDWTRVSHSWGKTCHAHVAVGGRQQHVLHTLGAASAQKYNEFIIIVKRKIGKDRKKREEKGGSRVHTLWERREREQKRERKGRGVP